MSTDESNPYQPTATDPKLGAPRGSLEYMRAVQYVFESPNWMMNLLWGSLCLLSAQVIPVVGQLLWMGYQFEIVEDLLCSPPKRGYVDFDINRFKEYLLRGLWIFLVTLVAALVMVPIMMVLMLGGMLVIGALGAATDGDEGAMTVGVVVLFALMIVVMFVFAILMTLVLTPLIIRAGLTQDFKASFDFAWIKDFVRQMWIEMILATIFMIAVAILAEIVGLLLCFIGIFPAVSAVMLMQAHLYLQLYQLYLARGGQKIPLKPAATIQPASPM